MRTHLTGGTPAHRIGRALTLLLCAFAIPLQSRADAVSEMMAFSNFDKVDLATLAKSDVNTTRGINQDRFISVQSCYVTPGTPEQQIAALRQWDPLKHKEMKVYLHVDLHGNSGPAEFARIKNAPDNSSVRSFVSLTSKMSSELQVSKEEAKNFSEAGGGGGGAMPENVASYWTSLLNNRFHLFLSGGAAAQPSYDHIGNSIQPGHEFSALLGAQEKIRKQFSGFLGRIGVGHSGGVAPDLFWELLDVDGKGVVTLGASYGRAGAGGPYQAADILYYASGGYYVSMTLYQMWPVTVEGKPSTLVWRGDMISSPQIASLHGVERLASEAAMKKDIAKGIALFRRESEHAH